MTAVAVVLTVAGSMLAATCWLLPMRRRVRLLLVALMVAALTVLAVLAVVAARPGGDEAGARVLLVLFAVLAVAGGGPVTVEVLRLAEGRRRSRGRTDPLGAGPPGGPGGPDEGLDEGEVLRGGAWIGSLERAGIFATLAAGWPEGVAVVLAVKGVGRYQELRGAPGASERFIIGTFASVLWAAACAGVWWFG